MVSGASHAARLFNVSDARQDLRAAFTASLPAEREEVAPRECSFTARPLCTRSAEQARRQIDKQKRAFAPLVQERIQLDEIERGRETDSYKSSMTRWASR